MPMSAELIFVRVLKLAAVAAALFVCLALVRDMVFMSCDMDGYSGGVLWAMYSSLLLLMVYSRFKFSSRGMVKLQVPLVRRAFVIVLAIEIAGIGFLFDWHGECLNIIRALPIPAALLLFYTAVIFSVVFGDAYLGVVRSIVRLGRKPTDFLRDTDRMS